MVKTTQGQSSGEKKTGVFVPEANIFITIEPGMDLTLLQQQFGQLSTATIETIQQALNSSQNSQSGNGQP